MADKNKASESEIREARLLYGGNDVSIDDGASTSVAGDGSGLWVSAWVWLQRESEGSDEHC